MIDINYIREHPQEMKQNILNRGLDPAVSDVDALLQLDDQRRELLQEVESLRARRNELTDQIAKAKDTDLIKEATELKSVIQQKEAKLHDVQEKWQSLMDWMPNITHPSMPVGSDESGNAEIKRVGEAKTFEFTPVHHIDLAERLDVIDNQKSGEVSGSRFYYLKNEGVLLYWGLMSLALRKLVDRGFTPMYPPVLVRERPLYGTGYFPSEAASIYAIQADEEKVEGGTQLYLTGTSEQAIVSYHMDDILALTDDAPLKYAGISACFRSEAGSWGRDTRGIKRVHQFDKVEMIYFTTPQSSQTCMQEALEVEEEILQELGLTYRVLEMCTGDVGMPTYRKFDVEVWMPGEQAWMETHSNSDLAQFHTRRLNIRYRTDTGALEFPHTISATALTSTRPIAAILDNYQQPDGSVEIPAVLQPYVGKDRIVLS